MEEGAPDSTQAELPQEEKKTKVSSILRPGSMGMTSHISLVNA